MRHIDDIQEQQAQEKLVREARDISEHIIVRHKSLFGVDPIEDLNQEELTSLVDTEFNRCGLNYLMVGNFDGYGTSKIPIELKTRESLQSINDVKELLNIEVDAFLSKLEQKFKECKAMIYDHLRAYQDEQNRNKQDNPYSN